MTNQHPITLPPELVQQWFTEWDNTQNDDCYRDYESHIFVATRAAQYGADQELEACCEWLKKEVYHFAEGAELRSARRPRPPSLKEEALGGLDQLAVRLTEARVAVDLDTIRRALEQLDD